MSTRTREFDKSLTNAPTHVGSQAPSLVVTGSEEQAGSGVVPIETLHPPESNEPFDAVSNLRDKLCRQLRTKLPANAIELAPEVLRRQLIVNLELLFRENDVLLDDADQQAVIRRILDDVYDYGPLTALMRDSEVCDILVNGPFQVFVEKKGRLEASDVTFNNAPQLVELMQRMVADAGRELDASHPMVDARLPDGSRMNAILNPPAINGPLLSIRRFGGRPLTVDDLIKNETLTPEMLEFLAAAVRGRLNIVISGGAGSGKTTLLNALSRFIRPSERIATIEDTAELDLQQPHVVKMEACADGNGLGPITMRELVKNTLRVRPDRIIIGECRGAEALEMLQAMNTGHEGSMTTIHANSPREVFSRVELMVSIDGASIPLWALRKQMASSIDLVVQVARQLGGRRKVVGISEVTGMEGDIISMHDIFQYEAIGVENGITIGHFLATGIRPTCVDRLMTSDAGLAAAPNFFKRRQLLRAEA